MAIVGRIRLTSADATDGEIVAMTGAFDDTDSRWHCEMTSNRREGIRSFTVDGLGSIIREFMDHAVVHTGKARSRHRPRG